MFETEGAARSDRQNRVLAGYLASVAGFVNAAGFLTIGAFTSHVTGNVGRLVDDLVLGRPEAALLAGLLVVAFFSGAFVSSMALESGLLVRRSSISAFLLLVEAAVLLAFVGFVRGLHPSSPRSLDGAAGLLCLAMGLQNSLVTRLSGAVVRTTHLTGIVTDLGIEAARWFRFWRTRLADHGGIRLTVSSALSERPAVAKTALLSTILLSFVGGATAGAFAVGRMRQDAMLIPAVALLVGAAFAVPGSRSLNQPGTRR